MKTLGQNQCKGGVDNRIIWAITIITAVILAVFAFILLSQDDGEQPHRLDTVTIAQTADFFLYAPVYIALDKGFFSQEGLDVKLISTGGDEKTWAAVLSGNADFGVSDPTFVAIAAERGQPGIVIASIVNGVPFWGITFLENVPIISDPADLKGYSVATFPSPSTAYTLQAKMFAQAGLKPEIREGAFGTLLQILKAEEADIALELEPNVSQAVEQGARVVYSLARRYGEFAITGLTTKPEKLRNDEGQVRKVILALQKALNFAHQNKAESVEILRKRFPEISPTVAQAAFERALADGIVPESVIVGSNAWAKALELRRESGDLTGDGGQDLLDNRCANWAFKEANK